MSCSLVIEEASQMPEADTLIPMFLQVGRLVGVCSLCLLIEFRVIIGWVPPEASGLNWRQLPGRDFHLLILFD
jgi:hypothetical protein